MSDVVAIRINNVNMLIQGDMPKDLRDEIRSVMSYVVPNAKYMTRYKRMGPAGWDGTKTVALYAKGHPGWLVAPTGLLSYLREILDGHGVPYKMIDERPPAIYTGGWATNLTLRDYQVPIKETMLKRQRGVLKMATGCHARGQLILMYDGSTKPVEDIVIGDLVMGPDSLPRKVLQLCRGRGRMYKILPTKGVPFTVNDEHILTLVRTNKHRYAEPSITGQERRRKNGLIVDVSIKEVLGWSKTNKHIHKLFRAGVIFKESTPLPLSPYLPPYLMGLFLSDGCLSNTASICNTYKEVETYKTAKNKFIPFAYKTASVEDRLQLLAGYIDGDGNYDNCYDAISKSRQLANDVCFLARSLGLAAYTKRYIKTCSTTKKSGVYHRISISGNIEKIPCKIPRKMASPRMQKKHVTRTGFKIKPAGIDNYYGFILDNDGRYLLEDFTVTHNSGKTETMISTMVDAQAFPAVFYVTSCDLLEQTYDRFSKSTTFDGKPAKIGRVGAGHCDIQPITIATVQSCQLALDGKFTKFDDETSIDKTVFSGSQKKDIIEIIKKAQFVYVDEAHHVSCVTIQSVLNNSEKAIFRIGGSASPWRDDGLDILIEACFGRRICDISASFLIQRGYLIKPYVTFNHFRQTFGPTATFNAHYKKYVTQNDARNQWIAERAQFHMERGRPTIILVKWIQHAESLAELIPGAEMLVGTVKPSVRKEKLNEMRARKLMCIIGTSLLDEGVDVPAAGAGIFAGGGKSSTRELQRVGRFIRVDPDDPDKDCAYIEEFYDHTKWLSHHAKLRRKILETEKEFEIGDNRKTLGE